MRIEENHNLFFENRTAFLGIYTFIFADMCSVIVEIKCCDVEVTYVQYYKAA